MIRPFTCVCLLLAAGSGLYLYQTKHQTQMVDREIERTLKLADATWQRSGVLRAEYTLLNDPSRLADLSGQYLPTLQPTAPGQFSTWNDFDRRLPAVGPPAPDPAIAEPTPAPQPEAVATEQPRPEIARPEPARPEPARVEQARLEPARPEPPRVDPPKPAITAAPLRPVVIAPPRVTPAPAPMVARSVPPPAPVTPAVTPAITNVAVLRPVPAPQVAPAATPAPFTGSMLGMARTMVQPAPAYAPLAGALR